MWEYDITGSKCHGIQILVDVKSKQIFVFNDLMQEIMALTLVLIILIAIVFLLILPLCFACCKLSGKRSGGQYNEEAIHCEGKGCNDDGGYLD